MEAVPKLPFISFELKQSPETTHFGPKLKLYIAEAYREDPDSYSNEMHQLEGLRSAAVRPSSDATGLSALYKYFCQLRAMQSRFPMAKGQPAAVPFAWKDLYANMSCSLADIRFEMACIMYNIGSLHTQLAASEPRNTPDSLKAAFSNCQIAAWSYQYIREQYPQPPGVDVSTEIMRLFQEICFAQAQECILEKSIKDTKKASIVGSVATQVLHYYKNSMALLGPSTGTDNIHEIIGTKLYNYWYRYLSFKCSYIGCIVCLYQGINAEEAQKMGERVAYYQWAVDKLAEARKLAKYIQPVQVTEEALTFTNDVVEGKRKAAKNENEFIYHEEVPPYDLLSEPKPVCLVKAVPVNFDDPEISGQDVFSRLIPIGAHEASSLYSEEKAKLLRNIVNQAETKNTELMKFMSSLQLEQLEMLDSEQSLPQELVDRCAAMNAKTEIIQSLIDTMNNLAEIISDVEHSLAECKNFIQEETSKEKEYQKAIGPRPPSIVQTELSRELHKYQEAHARTNESNQVLHKAMTLHIANLTLLAQPLQELQEKIPAIDLENVDRDTITEMRRVVDKARGMQTQRDSLIQELRVALTADDITHTLLARDAQPTDEVFKKELEKHTPKVKIIEQNLAAQENIINRLTTLYASYGEFRRTLTDTLRKREGLIHALITSYDSYEELLGKSQKGLEFYKKLSHNVNQLLSRLRSTCQVQEEERAQMMSQQAGTAPVAASPPPSESSDVTARPAASSGGAKLKDYLPYMKSRGVVRSTTPQVQPEMIPSDTYYPESIYPTSLRPAPVGSEADSPQMKYPDGYTTPQPNPYNPYVNQYAASENNPYGAPNNYAYPNASKTSNYDMNKPSLENAYGHTTPYTPPQYSTQITNPQSHTYNPYYTGTQDNVTRVTDSPSVPYNTGNQANMTPNPSQYAYDPYNVPTSSYANPIAPIPEAVSTMSAYSSGHQDLNASFSQMQVSKPEPKYEAPSPHYGNDYSQTYYSVNYPHVSTPNMATYSHSIQNTRTDSTPSQIPSDYSSMNYPYANIEQTPSSLSYPPNSIIPAPNAYSIQDQPYSYSGTSSYDNVSQGYPIYTNAENTSMTYSAASMAHSSASADQTFGYPNDTSVNSTTMPAIDVMDKPIKSHVTGEALSAYQNTFQTYNYPINVEQSVSTPNCPQEPSTQNYDQSYQNHPGYTFNSATGCYQYNYGSQNSFASFNSQSEAQPGKDVHSTQVYTNAGAFDTVQSPSETPDIVPNQQPNSNPVYYNSPYGYQTVQPNEMVPNTQSVDTNYGANVNQSTYMQSGQVHSTNVTYSSVQVSNAIENTEAQSYNQNTVNYQNTPSTEQIPTPMPHQKPPENYQHQPENYQAHTENYQTPAENYQNQGATCLNQVPAQPEAQNLSEQKPSSPEPVQIPDEKPAPSVFDLLSDIDFTVEQKPILVPEIKVPQVSESAIKKPAYVKMEAPKPTPKVEELIERPAKVDLFSDPTLLNKFTQEVKGLQKLVDSLTNKTAGGLTVLDSKWKAIQDAQANENMRRSKSKAMQNAGENIVTEVVPFDDSRLTLKSDPDAYINASYYKQLAPWCIPLVISSSPAERQHSRFWRAVLENKISCMVCLATEIEMQGKSYWPTAKGQCLNLDDDLKVSLEEVATTVHWTERKLTVTDGNSVMAVSHFQINVFPAKIVCSPLILLADKVLSLTYEGRLSNQLVPALVQCGSGGGRSALVALVLMLVSQVRAGQINLCEMLDTACINLSKHRSNVLEDTKFLADAYRTALFFAQGVLCSGTTMFNGEAVSIPTSASYLPPTTALAPVAPPVSKDKDFDGKPMKFSRESFEEMKQSPGLTSGDMKDPLNFLDPLWSLKKK